MMRRAGWALSLGMVLATIGASEAQQAPPQGSPDSIILSAEPSRGQQASSGQPQETIVLSAEAFSIPLEEQIANRKKWQKARGIHETLPEVRGETITFTYGSSSKRRMKVEEFKTFVEKRLSGFTIVTLTPASAKNSKDARVVHITYYGADGRFAYWQAGAGRPALGKWEVKRTTPEQQKNGSSPLLVCEEPDLRSSERGQMAFTHCGRAYDRLTAIHEKRPGDAFKLASGSAPGILDPLKPPAWPDGSSMLVGKAPHE